MFLPYSVIPCVMGVTLLLQITAINSAQQLLNESFCVPIFQPERFGSEGFFKILHMTPLWLQTHASFINCQHTVSPAQMTFNEGSVNEAALLKIPLVAAGVLQDSIRLTVEITAVHDVHIGNTFDSDIRYGISDGSRFLGFEACDKENYPDHAPCYGVEGIPGVSSLSSIRHIEYESPRTKDLHYPGQFVFTLKLDERWGSCHTAHDGGFTKVTGYSHRLMFSKGLCLEVYKGDSGEKVGIKYIKAVVMETSSF
ncbi:hypothetical protein ACROYT_G017609 [Oculina patagonica]